MEITKLQQQVKDLIEKKKSRSSTFKRIKKVGTSQVVSSPEYSIHLEEDASNQGRNETVGSGEANELNDNDGAGLDGTRLDKRQWEIIWRLIVGIMLKNLWLLIELGMKRFWKNWQ